MKYEVINRVNCVNLNMITEDGSKQVMSLSLTSLRAKLPMWIASSHTMGIWIKRLQVSQSH